MGTIFLLLLLRYELPDPQAQILTLLAGWWGLGQLVAGLFAWAFIRTSLCVLKAATKTICIEYSQFQLFRCGHMLVWKQQRLALRHVCVRRIGIRHEHFTDHGC